MHDVKTSPDATQLIVGADSDLILLGMVKSATLMV